MASNNIKNLKIKVIACKTVGEEVQKLLSKNMDYVGMDFGLHGYPERLNNVLKEEIEKSQEYDVILFGYGLCSMGTVGLSSSTSKLVIPKMHDCIGIFLGSQTKYKEQFQQEPGTYYLTRGWIKHGGDPYKAFLNYKKKYGKSKSMAIVKKIMKNYKRLAFIQTGNMDIKRDRNYAKLVAKFLNVKFEEIKGSDKILKKMIKGLWDEDFVVVEPGQKISFDMFT